MKTTANGEKLKRKMNEVRGFTCHSYVFFANDNDSSFCLGIQLNKLTYSPPRWINSMTISSNPTTGIFEIKMPKVMTILLVWRSHIPLKLRPKSNSDNLAESASSPLSDFTNSAMAALTYAPPSNFSNTTSASAALPLWECKTGKVNQQINCLWKCL